MKKIVLAVSVVLGLSTCLSSVEASELNLSTSVEYSAGVNVPTGNYWNGQSVITVGNGWVRIAGTEYKSEAQKGMNGSVVLSLYRKTGGALNPQYEYAGSLTIFPDGTLVYNDTHYKKG